MWRALLATVFVVAAATHASAQWIWKEFVHDGRPALRCRIDARTSDAPQPWLVVFCEARSDATALESELDRDWPASLRGDVRVAAPLATDVSTDEDLAAMLADLAREQRLEGDRVHVAGVATGATRALRFARSHADLVASVFAFAPDRVAWGEPSDLDLLIELPVALFRGTKDAREPVLAIVERAVELGSPNVQLEYVSNAEHARPPLSSARLAELLGRFREDARGRASAEGQVRELLTSFHAAASRADGPAYFGCMAAGGVFIGTDATERWTVPQFRAYCEPYFSQGNGWTYVATERHVGLSRDRSLAWFDERLANEKYGEVRGSGVLRRVGDNWRIAQYVMSFPVPNDLSGELVRRIRERGR